MNTLNYMKIIIYISIWIKTQWWSWSIPRSLCRIGEDLEDEVLGAEGLDADLGLVGVLAHAAEDEVAEGLDAVLALQEYAKPQDPLIFLIISDHFENLFISQQCGCDDNCWRIFWTPEDPYMLEPFEVGHS